MAQHDYVIANGTGAAVRSDLNGGLAAIVSNNSGATEPTTMYAYQWWPDTTTGLLKIRNAANNAWVTVGTLASTNLGLLSLAGGTMTGALAVTAGTAALPGIAVSGDLNTGITSPGADQLAISTGGTSRLAVSTTAVSSTLAVDVPLGAVATPSLTFTGDLNTGIYSPGADQVAITTGGTQRLNADTTAVTSTLPVVHPLGAVGTPSITFTGDLNTGIYSPGADTLALVTAGTNRLHVTSAGLVGINTASPSGLLHVKLATNKSLLVQDGGTDSIELANYDASDGYRNFRITGSPLRFHTGTAGSGSATERARIDESGLLLINTSSAFGVAGRVNILYTSSVESGISIRSSVDSYNTAISFLNNSGTQVGYISTGASSTTYNTSSDYRLKENVTPVPNGITRLLQLKPSRFNFIAEPDRIVDGFLAHEAQAVVPECVTGEKDAVDADGNPVYQGIDQSKLVPLLTAALQEAIAEINALKDRLTAAGIA